MSGIVECCGQKWAAGAWSDALYATGVQPAHGDSCGACGAPLVPDADVEPERCGQPFCGADVEVHAHVIGGPVLFFCGTCALKFEEECKLTGVASKVALRKAGKPCTA